MACTTSPLTLTDSTCPKCQVITPAIAWEDTGEIISPFCPTGCYDQYATAANRRTWTEILEQAIRDLPDHLRAVEPWVGQTWQEATMDALAIADLIEGR